MNQTVLLWIKGLVAAFIGGAANSITAIIIDPQAFNLGEQWAKTASFALVSGVVSAALYLKKSPLPGVGVKDTLTALLICALLLPLTACGKEKSLAQIGLDVNVGIQGAVKTLREINQAGRLSDAEYSRLLDRFEMAQAHADRLNQQLDALAVIDGSNKSEVLLAIGELSALIAAIARELDPQNEGLQRVAFFARLGVIALNSAAIAVAGINKPVAPSALRIREAL